LVEEALGASPKGQERGIDTTRFFRELSRLDPSAAEARSFWRDAIANLRVRAARNEE
jgi:hypothetical protein